MAGAGWFPLALPRNCEINGITRSPPRARRMSASESEHSAYSVNEEDEEDASGLQFGLPDDEDDEDVPPVPPPADHVAAAPTESTKLPSLKLVLPRAPAPVLQPLILKVKQEVPRTGKAEAGGREPLYCVCRQPYRAADFMIECDACADWFHGACVLHANLRGRLAQVCRGQRDGCGGHPGVPLPIMHGRSWSLHGYACGMEAVLTAFSQVHHAAAAPRPRQLRRGRGAQRSQRRGDP